ncbi:MAG: ABC transporter ATP-binding protein [Candidatus Rokubacteria bacterium]|nr:ABC transporter ATP-binding protein [Candidatus Rokubacteria bacterium]
MPEGPTDSADARIRVDGVSKVFETGEGDRAGAVVALEAIDFVVHEHEILCLLGPSGCGKSTILNIIAGFDVPSAGRVTVDGKTVMGPGPERIVVFQSPALFPWLTVRDNVTFGPRFRGDRPAAYNRLAEEYLRAVGLQGFEDHYPYQLSGGMRQRVALARALIGGPAILLLDEPFGALDAQTRLAMQELLLGIWERYQPTILFITHDVEEAIFLADRILVMTPRPGRVRAELAVPLPRPRTYRVLTSPEFVALKEQILSLVHSSYVEAADGGQAAPWRAS